MNLNIWRDFQVCISVPLNEQIRKKHTQVCKFPIVAKTKWCLIISKEILLILVWRKLNMFNFFILKSKRISKSSFFVKYTVILKETHNSFKTWPLNFWWISNKTIMEDGNITEAATFNKFSLPELLKHNYFFCDSTLNYFHEIKIKRLAGCRTIFLFAVFYKIGALERNAYWFHV